MGNMTEFDELLERVQKHFTPEELISFLDVGYLTLFNSEALMECIEDNMEELKEEMGV